MPGSPLSLYQICTTTVEIIFWFKRERRWFERGAGGLKEKIQFSGFNFIFIFIFECGDYLTLEFSFWRCRGVLDLFSI